MNQTLTRREMLTLMSFVTLEITGLFSSVAFATEKQLRKSFKRLTKQPELESLITVGKMYLEAVPEEADTEKLLQYLPNAETLDETYWDTLHTQVRSDFIAGQTVSLDGWVLSQSECRLYGLLFLLAQ